MISDVDGTGERGWGNLWAGDDDELSHWTLLLYKILELRKSAVSQSAAGAYLVPSVVVVVVVLLDVDGHLVHDVVVDGVHVLGHMDDDVLAETTKFK